MTDLTELIPSGRSNRQLTLIAAERVLVFNPDAAVRDDKNSKPDERGMGRTI